ncbi:hypothetical protein LNP00_00260 [Fructobacillus sp. M158]|uniref:hypothetical protein n=1 Tax=Fructobacillus parabroussonetiae TaxID=2713174 RepID=UPI00200A2BEE|nr:hypothetical protein [Fructobacillus parabroussonetiae]MCK8616803.1 hypothetical protein [Fructobacillus parabroussonetiae]
MFRRIEEVNLSFNERYRPSKTGVFLGFVVLLGLGLLVTHQVTRLSGSYAAVAKENRHFLTDTIDFHNEDVVTNLAKADRWTHGSYDLNGQQLTVTVASKQYKGRFVQGRQKFYLEVNQHKEYFTKN